MRLCDHVAVWLCGYSELCASLTVGGRLLISWSHVAAMWLIDALSAK